MGSSTLEAVPAGMRVTVDATVFIYHFTATSPSCRNFLARCETGDVRGVTSTVIIAEISHRLMMLEARARGLITGGGVAKKLRERPEIVSQLRTYAEQVEKIPLMGIDISPLDLPTLQRALFYQRQYGLLTNDSLLCATAERHNAMSIASADRDFGRVAELTLYAPADLV